jgi:hypothetical protein
MAQLFKWKVIREHVGDREYAEGEERVGTKDELGSLEGKLLELVGPAAFDGKGDHDGNGETGGAAPALKSEDPPLNKAEPAPANKAASSRKSKRT